MRGSNGIATTAIPGILAHKVKGLHFMSSERSDEGEPHRSPHNKIRGCTHGFCFGRGIRRQT